MSSFPSHLRAGLAGFRCRSILSLLLASAGLTACRPPAHVSVPRPVEARIPYRITPGDTLEVRFYRTPELNVSLPVRSDGRVQLELVGEVDVAGREPEVVAKELEERYALELERPRIAVVVKKFGARVYVGGEVKNPSRVTLSPGMTALQAIDAAGGFVDRSQASWVVLIRRTPAAYEATRLALHEVLAGDDPSKDVVLEAGDILEVPKKPVVHLNVFVQQYIRDNLPVQPLLPVF